MNIADDKNSYANQSESQQIVYSAASTAPSAHVEEVHAHLQGPEVKKCHCNFNTRFHLFKCTKYRNLAGIYIVEQTRSPISHPGYEIPFYTKDIHVDMIEEI